MNKAERVTIAGLLADCRDQGIQSPHADRLERLLDAHQRTSGSRRQLPAQSERRKNERDQRAAVRQRVQNRDRGCVAPARGLPGDCGWLPGRLRLEVHEVAQRSTHPGSHLVDDLCVTLCPFHHDMVTSPVGEMRELVEQAGLIVRSNR